MIYFVYARKVQAIKIGFHGGQSVYTRLQALPEPLELLGVLDGDRAAKRELHQRFSSCRLEGEWFSATDDLLAFIRIHAQPPPDPPAFLTIAAKVSVSLSEALEAFVSSNRLKPRLNSILVAALEDFLQARGFWPPKKGSSQ